MIEPAVWQEFAEHLDQARHIVICNPKDADADSLGATLGLALYLRGQGKTAQVFTAKTPSERYRFLTGFDTLITDVSQLDLDHCDLVITADFADPRQLGVSDEILTALRSKPLVNLDHHQTNYHFGSLNIVDPSAAATTELLWQFFEHQGIRYDKHIATCLLTGIIADTGGFVHLNTTEHVVNAASQLLLRGARLRTIIDHMTTKPLVALRLWGLALSRLQHNERYGLSITCLTQQDLEELGATEEAAEGIANFLNSLAGSKAIIVLRENSDGLIKGSIRSTMPGVDISHLARVLGGGGHAKAAGFAVPGRLTRVGHSWQIA